LTAQQQKIFEMNNHPHGLGPMASGHPAAMAMSFHKNPGAANNGGPQGANGGTILPANVVPSTHA